MLGVFGPDRRVDTRSEGWGGDLHIVTGSTSAQGLPAGYDVVVRFLSLTDATSAHRACTGRTEKGTVWRPCTALTAPDGTRLTKQEVAGSGTVQGTFLQVSLTRERADGSIERGDLIAVGSQALPTTAERAQASTWLDGQLSHLATAVLALETPPS